MAKKLPGNPAKLTVSGFGIVITPLDDGTARIVVNYRKGKTLLSFDVRVREVSRSLSYREILSNLKQTWSSLKLAYSQHDPHLHCLTKLEQQQGEIMDKLLNIQMDYR